MWEGGMWEGGMWEGGMWEGGSSGDGPCSVAAPGTSEGAAAAGRRAH